MDSTVSDAIVFNSDGSNVIFCMQSNRHFPVSILQAMFEDDTMCDVTLYGKAPAGMDTASSLPPIRAYKTILAHASAHLYNHFTSDDFIDSHKTEYKTENVDHEVLRSIVKFIHTDELRINVTDADEQVRGILIGAKYLVIPKLAEACESFLGSEKQLKIGNCVSLWCFARKYICLELMHACSTFIAENIGSMPNDANFLRMLYADCAKLLMSEAFIATDAEARYRAALGWLNYDSDGRGGNACDVLNMVPFVHGPLSIETVLEANACVTLKRNAAEMVQEASLNALKRAKSTQKSASTFASFDENRYCCDNWFIVGGYDSSTEQRSFLSYDIVRRTWSSLASLPWSRCVAGTGVVDKRLILVGGWKQNERSADVDEFDLSTKMWSTSSLKLGSARSCMGACSDGKRCVYILGGVDETHKRHDVVERFNIESAEVKQLCKMPTTRSAQAVVFSATSNSSRIFMAGGIGGSNSVNSIEMYDICGNKWSSVGNMASRRNALAGVLSGDNLYLVGGKVSNKATSVAEIFNIRTGQTQTAPNLLEARSFCSCVALYDERVLCVIGGSKHGLGLTDELRTVEVYDIREGKWSTGVIVPDMPTGLAAFGFAAV